MRKNIQKAISLAMLAVMVVPVAACGGGDDTPSAEVNAQYEWLSGTYKDTSDLTSWGDLGQTKQLSLTAWNTLQQGGFKEITASNDVVYPEIKRVTGVTIDEVFDNNGNNADAAWNLIQVTGEIPDIAYGSWVDPNEVYDLTELIDKYCPTIKARMPESVWNASNINGGQKGKVYSIPYSVGSVSLSAVDDKADPAKTIMFENSTNYYPFIYVREDILEDAYGAENVYTTAELEALYAEQGYFTAEQFFDVNITSAEDFRKNFLPKIYNTIHSNEKYKINGERWVECMLTGYGSDGDTWDFMGNMIPALLGATGNWLNTEFTYWDAVDQEVQLLIKEDFYQAELKEWVKLIQEGKYVSDYGILNGKNVISGELNSGYYAIGYEPSSAPNGQQANYKGETVKYRKVYLNIEKNEHFEFFNLAAPAVQGVCIFKDSVKESDLPQILRWLDYQCSEVFDKCVGWGPKSAGLFTEDANGVRQFKNETLANQMVYSTVSLGAEAQKYNLCPAECEQANITFTFYWGGGSKDHPKCHYDLSSIGANFQKAYAPSAVFPDKKPVNVAKQACIWKWSDSDLDGVETVWAKRPGVEKALFSLLRSGTSGYDAAWNTVLQTLNVSGWTDSYFAGDYTEAFLNLNEDYLSGFYKG